MVKRAVGTIAVLVAVLVAAVWWFYPDTAVVPASAQAPPPGVPVTAGTVVAADVPVLLNGIGTVQAYNIGDDQEPGRRPDRQGRFHRGAGGQGGRRRCSRSTRGPTRRRSNRRSANQEKDKAKLANAQRNFARDASIVEHEPRSLAAAATTTEGASCAADQATVDSDKAQIETARLNLGYADHPLADHGRLGARLVDAGNMVHASDATAAWSRSRN